VQDPGKVDPEDARAFLREWYGSAVTNVVLLAGGEWSRAYAFRAAGRQLVVRFSALELAFRKDERAARFATPSLPIPEILEIGPHDGGFYAISERRHGAFLEDASRADVEALLPALLGALDAMRETDLGATHGFGGWLADGHAPFDSWPEALLDVAVDRRDGWTAGWRDRLAASPIGSRPFDEAYGALREVSADLPDVRSLVHSDLLNRNVLVDGGRVSAVLDWGSSIYGDFLLDLGWLDFWRPWYPEWQDVDVVEAALAHYRAIGLAVPQFEARLRACELWIGLDGLAYQAFAGHWSDLERTSTRMLEIAGQVRG
jgi:hygromycin-B 4-O-kinase